jgi:phosphoglycolate phosphatase-like HAD superfamily hydrolase
MTKFSGIKNILWDFDGVLMDSMAVREEGFRTVLQEFPPDQVNQLLLFHRRNGGLSRYVKFRYFFETIRKETAAESTLSGLASAFSAIMRERLTQIDLLIPDSVNFVKANHHHFKMHIVSGSDQEELVYLCQRLELSTYFNSIHGSPTPKRELIANVLSEQHYHREETVMIGDSVNDLEAAEVNRIQFLGYNSNQLKNSGVSYVDSFNNLSIELH